MGVDRAVLVAMEGQSCVCFVNNSHRAAREKNHELKQTQYERWCLTMSQCVTCLNDIYSLLFQYKGLPLTCDTYFVFVVFYSCAFIVLKFISNWNDKLVCTYRNLRCCFPTVQLRAVNSCLLLFSFRDGLKQRLCNIPPYWPVLFRVLQCCYQQQR